MKWRLVRAFQTAGFLFGLLMAAALGLAAQVNISGADVLHDSGLAGDAIPIAADGGNGADVLGGGAGENIVIQD